MEQLIEFAGNHLLLVIALFVISGALAWNLIAGGGKNNIPPSEATVLINRVDVRPIADFNKGHIVHSINLPINGFKNQIKQLEKHKSTPVIVSCRSGNQSQMACRELRKAGFERVYNLRGGVMAWQGANLPLTRKK